MRPQEEPSHYEMPKEPEKPQPPPPIVDNKPEPYKNSVFNDNKEYIFEKELGRGA